MKKLLLMFFGLFAMLSVFAQSNDVIIGQWKTVDDATGEAKSIVEIFKKKDGKYYGKIVELFKKPENANCVKCKDDRKDKPLIGMEVIRGLTKSGSEYSGGSITDPQNGKSYKCTVSRTGDVLSVRGFVGFSLIGRTQKWSFVK